MTTQAQSPDGLLRWYVYTDRGRKTLWEPTAVSAQARAERHGLTVQRVEPAPPAAMPDNAR